MCSLGGPLSDFMLTNDDGFGVQYAPRYVDGEILLFDNGYSAGESRLAKFSVDTSAATAERTWEWRHPDALYAILLGDVDALDDERHPSSWSRHGEILVTAKDGGSVWRVDFQPTFVVGKVEPFDAS